MITTRKVLKQYQEADLAHSYVPKSPFIRFLYTIHGNEQCNAFRYVRCLRKYEYHLNAKHRIRSVW